MAVSERVARTRAPRKGKAETRRPERTLTQLRAEAAVLQSRAVQLESLASRLSERLTRAIAEGKHRPTEVDALRSGAREALQLLEETLSRREAVRAALAEREALARRAPLVEVPPTRATAHVADAVVSGHASVAPPPVLSIPASTPAPAQAVEPVVLVHLAPVAPLPDPAAEPATTPGAPEGLAPEGLVPPAEVTLSPEVAPVLATADLDRVTEPETLTSTPERVAQIAAQAEVAPEAEPAVVASEAPTEPVQPAAEPRVVEPVMVKPLVSEPPVPGPDLHVVQTDQGPVLVGMVPAHRQQLDTLTEPDARDASDGKPTDQSSSRPPVSPPVRATRTRLRDSWLARALRVALHPRQLMMALLVALLVVLAATLTPLPELFGWQLFAVESGSMSPAIPVGSIVAVQSVLPQALHVGDVITFSDRNRPDVRVTHRIVALESRNGQQVAITKGDANNTTDSWNVPVNDAIGRVRFHVPNAGYAVYWLATPGVRLVALAGVVLLLILPALSGRRRLRPVELAPRTALEPQIAPAIEDSVASAPALAQATTAEASTPSFETLSREIDDLLAGIGERPLVTQVTGGARRSAVR